MPNFRDIYFKPSMEFRNHHTLFRRFRPDDIISLNLSNNRTFTNLVADNLSNLDAILPHLVHIKSIASFSGADSRLSAKGIQFLDQLPNLLDLKLERTELVGKELARLRALPKLYALGLDSVRDVKPILHKLRGSSAMRTLLMVNCHLDSQQINLLSTTKLERLDIENNPDVTDSCVDPGQKIGYLVDVSIKWLAWSADKSCRHRQHCK